MKEINKRNYNAVVNRGLISPNTTITEFITKLHEEVKEFTQAYEFDKSFGLSDDFTLSKEAIEEAGDILNVIKNMFYHFGIDEEEVLIKIAEKNERRSIK